MADWHAALGILAGILSASAYVPYILETLRGSVNPNRSSWFIWMLVDWIMLISSIQSGASTTLWFLIAFTTGATIVFLLSLRYGQGGWTPLDRWCFLGVGITLVIWAAFNSPVAALVLGLTINAIGAIPTILKLWYRRGPEPRVANTIGACACLLNILAINRLEFAIIIFPVGMAAVCWPIWILAIRYPIPQPVAADRAVS